MRPLRPLWPALAGLVIAVTAAVVVFARPVGERGPQAAALLAVQDEARAGSSRVLLQRPWGEGRLILVGYRDDGRKLALAFAIDQGRGWRVPRITTERAELEDVKGHDRNLGSMLISTSDGGRGQPAWSAVFGEVADDRVASVAVTWASGEVTTAEVRNAAYLAVRPGGADPALVRFLAADGTEIARVAVDQKANGAE